MMKTLPVILKLFAACCLALLTLGQPHTQAQSPQSLVTIESGNLPIILSAPHGGSKPIPGVREREGKGVDKFKRLSDAYTGQLTEKLADAIADKLGKRPYVVIARFHRKYVDANRPSRLAYESDAAKATYDTYHHALATARNEVIARWGRGVLLDIHGQSAKPKTIIRGTQNGKTTSHLITRFGREALISKTSLFGQLAKQGFSVNPTVGSTDDEHPSYNGGYIVRTYGSQESGTVDAIQLELGRELRSPTANDVTADKLANAITAFATDYLPVEKHAETTDGDASAKQATQIGVQADRGFANTKVISEDFANGNRVGWFELDDDSSVLTVKAKSGKLRSLPELSFGSSDATSLKTFATHFKPVKLEKTGDQVSVTFDARHDNSGFVDRAFRFGLFDSKGTRFNTDGDHDVSTLSLDDDGYFVMLDLGSSTTNTSALIRETNNTTDERLWKGKTIADHDNDGGADLLMFTRDMTFTYTLTLTRNATGSIDVHLSNKICGEEDALTGTSTLTRTLTLDTLYFGTFGSTADFSIDNVVITTEPNADAPSSGQAVRVGLYIDKGIGGSFRHVLRALSRFKDVSVTKLTADDIRSGKLNTIDVLIQPGGSGSGQGNHLGEAGRIVIRDYVRDGGGFVGICGGAYLASAHYKWSLNILDAKVVDTKHWARGHGMVEIGITEAGRKLLQTDESQLTIQYWQGPLLAPANRPEIDDYVTIATFDTEIAENGAPEGVMLGTTAIAKGKFGNGRVICFSPHPELTDGLEDLLKYAIDHVKKARSN